MKKSLSIPAYILLLSIAAIAVTALIVSHKSKSTALQLEEPEENNPTVIDNSRDKEGDTFSIVAYDSNTGEVGGAGCSCYGGTIDFLSDLITDGTTNSDNIVGAIHSQASYNAGTQAQARSFMLAGQTPQQIITNVVAGDGGSASRQYGVVGVDFPGTGPEGFTGGTNGNWAGHQTGNSGGFFYSIQGNILDPIAVGSGGQRDILNDMEDSFNAATGSLADKLMAALQGAKRVGGDIRCDGTGNSGRAAFVKVLRPGDTSPYIFETTFPNVNSYEPIDDLQCDYDVAVSTPNCRETITLSEASPYAMDFETKSWEKEGNCSTYSSWIRTRLSTPSGSTGPTGANQGSLYTFFEASDVGGQGITAGRQSFIASPCFVVPSNHTGQITFDYHMWGVNMGTLALTASDNDGSSWSTIWSRSGDQGNVWHNNETIDISSYAGSTVKFRFEATSGSGFEGDMALDDINISVTSLCPTSSAWNGSSWDNGVPTISTSTTISGNYNTGVNGGSLDVCEITVTNNATLTIDSGDYLNVNGNITVDAGASLIVQHTGAVVQVDDDATVTNNGTINVNLTTPFLEPRDFMIMGSPMSAETRNDVFTNAFLVLQHTPANFIPFSGITPGATNFEDDNGDFWSSYNGAINVGEGFLVRPQLSYADGNSTYNMTYTQGTLNNGAVNRSVTFNGVPNPDGTPNVFSNPYASPISASDFITANALVNEVYFWEHLTSPSNTFPGNGTTNFSMDDISMYNLSGGTAAANDPGTTTEPNGVISTGQGFGIKAFGSGSVTFNNSMRQTSGNTTLRTPETIDRIWLRVSNNQYDYKLGSNTLIAFNPQATVDMDPGYDSERIATAVSLYTHLENSNTTLGIQTLNAFDLEKKVSMGFASQVDEVLEYTISIAKLDGARIEDATVYLIDNELNTITNLNEEDYNFESGEGDQPGRFALQFEYESLGTNDLSLEQIAVYPNPADDIIQIISPELPMQNIEIYDLQGRRVMSSLVEVGSQNRVQLNISSLNQSIYFVKIYAENKSITQRIVKK